MIRIIKQHITSYIPFKGISVSGIPLSCDSLWSSSLELNFGDKWHASQQSLAFQFPSHFAKINVPSTRAPLNKCRRHQHQHQHPSKKTAGRMINFKALCSDYKASFHLIRCEHTTTSISLMTRGLLQFRLTFVLALTKLFSTELESAECGALAAPHYLVLGSFGSIETLATSFQIPECQIPESPPTWRHLTSAWIEMQPVNAAKEMPGHTCALKK